MKDQIETWINGRLRIVDISRVWQLEYDRWSELVDPDTASAVACNVENTLRESLEDWRSNNHVKQK